VAIIQQKTSPTDWPNCSPNLVARQPQKFHLRYLDSHLASADDNVRVCDLDAALTKVGRPNRDWLPPSPQWQQEGGGLRMPLLARVTSVKESD
jgi:hypothetical protein